jgi:hypothetical protein
MERQSFVDALLAQEARRRDEAVDNVLCGGVRESILYRVAKDGASYPEFGLWITTSVGVDEKVRVQVSPIQASTLASFPDGNEAEMHPALKLLADECRDGHLNVRCAVHDSFTGFSLTVER